MKIFTNLFFLLFLLSGCLYPKVSITKQQKEIASNCRKQKSIILYSNTGFIDTIEFTNYGYVGKYKPNLDVFWEIMVHHRTNKSRELYCHVQASSNLPYSNKYKDEKLRLSLDIRLKKNNNTEQLTLTIDAFEEKFIIDENINDTLVFQNLRYKGDCKGTNCLRKVYFNINKGIVSIEKKDGSIWKLKKTPLPQCVGLLGK